MRIHSCICLISIVLLSVVPQRASAQDWEGGYAGAHAGFRWADIDLSTPAYSFPDGFGGTVQIPARNESFDISRGIVGVHAGYNILLSPSWLIGLEADWTAGGGDKSRSAAFSTSNTVLVDDEIPVTITTNQVRVSEVDLGWQGTIRARFGFVNGGMLFYGTAGVAFMDADWNETISIAGGASNSVGKSSILTGLVLGAGIEGFLSSNLLGRIEYLYEDFDSHSVPLAFTTNEGELDVTVQKLRVGISLKF